MIRSVFLCGAFMLASVLALPTLGVAQDDGKAKEAEKAAIEKRAEQLKAALDALIASEKKAAEAEARAAERFKEAARAKDAGEKSAPKKDALAEKEAMLKKALEELRRAAADIDTDAKKAIAEKEAAIRKALEELRRAATDKDAAANKEATTRKLTEELQRAMRQKEAAVQKEAAERAAKAAQDAKAAEAKAKAAWRVVDAQGKTKTSDDAKLQELEARLQALLKEIQALRAAPKSAPPAAKPTEPMKTTTIDRTIHFDSKYVPAGEAFRRWSADAKPATSGEKRVITVVGDGMETKGAGPAGEKKTIVIEVDDGKDGKIEKRVITLGPDGKPLPGQKVVVEELKDKVIGTAPAHARMAIKTPQDLVTHTLAVPAGQPGTIALSRTTYTMPADKAKALDGFLKDNVKGKVLETKLEGDKLTVTTTPEVQGTIGQLVGLMTGQATPHTFHLELKGQPGAPGKYEFTLPAKPTEPKKP